MLLTDRGLCASIFLPLRSCFTAFRFLVALMVSSHIIKFEFGWPACLPGDCARGLPMFKHGSASRMPLILRGMRAESARGGGEATLSFSTLVEISLNGLVRKSRFSAVRNRDIDLAFSHPSRTLAASAF
jgi:hypothetical protein